MTSPILTRNLMFSLSPDHPANHLRRLEQLLTAARAEYDALAYIIIEGATQVTYYSLKRSITVAIGGDDTGHLNGLLAEAVLNRIKALEKEIVETHAQVVDEADGRQLDENQLAAYRQQARAQEGGTMPAGAFPPLASSTQSNPDEHSP